MSDVVIREVSKGVWTFSRPFTRFGLPIGGRSTAIQLQNGGVWVLASTPLTPGIKDKLGELGPVKFIVGPNAVHYLFLGEFKKAYPDAKLLAVEEAIQKYKEKNLKFDGVFGRDPPEKEFGFENEIKHCHFTGFRNKDVVFFHPASKTLLQADLIFNLPPTEQYSNSKSSGQVPLIGGSFNPYSWFHSRFTWMMGIDKKAMRHDVKTVAGWDFEKIIPCHGDVIEKDGRKVWQAAYNRYFD